MLRWRDSRREISCTLLNIPTKAPLLFFHHFLFRISNPFLQIFEKSAYFLKKNAELNIQLYKTLKVLWNKNRVTLEVIWMMSDLYILNI